MIKIKKSRYSLQLDPLMTPYLKYLTRFTKVQTPQLSRIRLKATRRNSIVQMKGSLENTLKSCKSKKMSDRRSLKKTEGHWKLKNTDLWLPRRMLLECNLYPPLRNPKVFWRAQRPRFTRKWRMSRRCSSKMRQTFIWLRAKSH